MANYGGFVYGAVQPPASQLGVCGFPLGPRSSQLFVPGPADGFTGCLQIGRHASQKVRNAARLRRAQATGH